MPHVVIHNATSVDGRIDGIEVDLGTFYGLAGHWDVDAHLAGSDTLIEGMAGADDATEPPSDAAEPPVDDAGGDRPPLLVVPDSRGRVSDWSAVRDLPFWGDVVVLCSRATDASYLDALDAAGVDTVVAGEDHVDYREALGVLSADYDVETVLVDSGGTLSGHLFAAGLVDEVSVLVHPQVVGGEAARPFVRGPEPAEAGSLATCSLEAVEQLKGDLVWLRYAVADE